MWWWILENCLFKTDINFGTCFHCLLQQQQQGMFGHIFLVKIFSQDRLTHPVGYDDKRAT